MHKWLIKMLFSIGMITAGVAICILSRYQKTSDERPDDLWSGEYSTHSEPPIPSFRPTQSIIQSRLYNTFNCTYTLFYSGDVCVFNSCITGKEHHIYD